MPIVIFFSTTILSPFTLNELIHSLIFIHSKLFSPCLSVEVLSIHLSGGQLKHQLFIFKFIFILKLHKNFISSQLHGTYQYHNYSPPGTIHSAMALYFIVGHNFLEELHFTPLCLRFPRMPTIKLC